MLSFSLWFLAGVYTATLMNVTSPFLPLTIFTVSVCLIAMRRARVVFVFLCGLLFCLASAQTAVSLRLPPEYSGDSLVVRGVIDSFPSSNGGGTRFLFRPDPGGRLHQRLSLMWYAPPVSLRIGDRWDFEVRLRPPRGLANPGSRDSELLALARGVSATGYIVSGSRNRLRGVVEPWSVSALRQGIVERIQAAMAGHRSVPVMVALSVGSRHLFTPERWREFAAGGISHLVAISGLHIGLLAGLCAVLCRMLCIGVRCNQRRLSVAVGVIGAGVYLLLSGLGLPAQRAFLMLLVIAICLVLGRRLFAPATLSLAAVCIVLHQPLSIVAPGLWLSFGAVASLFWWAQLQQFASPARTAVQQLWSAQIMLFFALLPLSGLIFGRLSLAAPVVNLVAVPVFSFIAVPATLLGALLPPAAELGLQVAAMAIEAVSVFSQWLNLLQSVVVARDNLLLMSLSALLFILLPRGFPGRLSILCVVPVLFWPAARGPDPGCFRASFFDVGQGTSILIETREHALLYDTGPPFGTTASAFATVVAPALDRLGIQTVDRILVSHADADHAGGVAAARARYPTAGLLVGEPLDGVDAVICSAQQVWNWDDVQFEILHPPATSTMHGNNRSCVLRVSTADRSLLLTGDIESAVEARLVQNDAIETDSVLVPHHGSRTSSTLAFVAATNPVFAIVTAGFDNRFGHPRADVLDRWRNYADVVMNTSESGAIRLRQCADEPPVLIETSRHSRRKLWHVTQGADL